MPDPQPRWRAVRLRDIDPVPLHGGTLWRPVRRALGVTAFGVNATSATAPGDEVVEPHDELSPGAGGHEELYVVLAGRATFTLDRTEVDAPAGSMVLVARGVPRAAVAREPGTTVLTIGGRPGAALPISPFEHWYAAQGAYEAGDYERATEIAAAGLDDWPQHAQLRYQLACFRALAGDRDGALAHLRVAAEHDERIGSWAAVDSDLDSIRDDPAFPRP